MSSTSYFQISLPLLFDRKSLMYSINRGTDCVSIISNESVRFNFLLLSVLSSCCVCSFIIFHSSAELNHKLLPPSVSASSLNSKNNLFRALESNMNLIFSVFIDRRYLSFNGNCLKVYSSCAYFGSCFECRLRVNT
jgi:hypothetical protein